jgi:rhodanese-related sulfurtransferase
MDRLLEYTAHHPFLVAAAAILAVIAIVIEIRQRAAGAFVVAPADAIRLANGGALILDVRDSKDYEAGHIIEARNVPAAEIAQRADTFKKYREKPVLVYCETGSASAGVARALRNSGFSKVVTLRGGLGGWRQENLPLVTTTGKKGGKQA